MAVEKCEATGKIIFQSRAAAQETCRRLNQRNRRKHKGEANPYRCHVKDGCGLWHVSSRGQGRRAGAERVLREKRLGRR